MTTDNEQSTLEPCPFCGGKPAWGEGEQKTKYGNEQVYCTDCWAITAPEGSKTEAAENWNTRVSADSVAPVVDEQVIRLLAAEKVANAARVFCEELQEDAEGVPQVQLSQLNAALDAWEAYPDARESFDDSRPLLAALASLIEDEHATDHQRRVAYLALSAIHAREGGLNQPDRDQLRRAIAESDIAGCALENSDIDSLVDLFQAWLERRAAASPAATQEDAEKDK